MKIAVISDIHANLFALEAVLAHAESQGVKQYWCLGDLVHFNLYPQEVVKTIRKLNPVAIHGNIDLRILEMRKQVGRKKEPTPSELEPMVWSYLQLSTKSRDYLSDLPRKKRIKIEGNRFLLTHGSPAGVEDPIRVDTPDDRLRDLAKMTKAEFILCGHTHVPFVREVDGVTFINPGSVGKPIDGDTRASYAILKVKKNLVAVESVRVEYNLKKNLKEMRAANLPEAYIRSLELGIGNDRVAEILAKEAADKAGEVQAKEAAEKAG